MFAKERQQAIRDIVRTHRRLSFTELEALVNVSPATLRRDLAELEQAGEIIRVHGGVLDPGYVRLESTLGERVVRHRSAKQAIARAAAELVPPGSTVLIDAGSTCLEAGKLLLYRKDVRIITHSVALIEAGLHGEAEVICIGGSLRKVSGALVGGGALGALTNLHGDFAFIGATATGPLGVTTTELTEADIKRAFLAAAPRKVLLADSSKWEQAGVVRFAQWSDFTDWVTEKPLTPSDMKPIKATGVKVRGSSK